MLEFKSKITGDPLGALRSWNDSVHFCEWYGVSCSKRHYGRVIELNLSSHGFYGSISPHVGNLSFLKFLRLYNNSFTGEIPPEIGRLCRLERLSLFNNLLDGEIPSNISRCSALTRFRVEKNELVGGLPWQFGLLKKLQYFYASSNNLSGSIPLAFGNLSSLLEFDGDTNQLSGRVPETLGKLKSLMGLYLSFNNLSGEIPASIFNLSSLTYLSFGYNYQLHGNLPWNLGVTLPNLEKFDVAANQFTGSIPPSLSNASNLVLLQLYSNNFTGSMPSMANSNKLTWVLIYNNSLGSGKANELCFLSSLTNATNLENLEFSGNNFGGSLPHHLGNLSTNLKRLAFSDNKISGNIPSSIQHLVNLEEFWAYNNDLSGTIPSSIGKLKFLERLHLYNNKLSGYIPSSMGNLTRLIELSIDDNYLFGEIPASIQNCRQLLRLLISSNSLSGVIPPQLLSLTSLSIVLDLSGNRFTGTLPAEVGNLKNLGILNLSHNMLSGSIPTSLGSCISLQGLYLQGNRLQGIIPSSFSSLRGLQELDLSSNNLSGQIPKFLESMDISSLLNLSYNNFDGEVPTQGAFKNNSIISVIGNSKLCGGISALKLPPCSFTRHTKKTLSLKWKIVISTISSLLFLTFIGSCCFILLIKQRRRRDKSSTDDPKMLQLSYQRLFKATDGFSSENQIGVGSFGSVYKGVLNEIGEASIDIAVKVFNLQRRGASKSFMAECEALRNIRHKNLVRIVTVCSSIDHEGNDFKALIYEFLANGSLEDWLHRQIERISESTTTRSLNFVQRLNAAIDIASAVNYLHSHCGTPIVHCDLKPSNVLLDEDMVAHVSDFGLARFLSTVKNPSSNTIGIKGTIGYAPPEYGMGNEVSIQGDVYSYGILLLELFTGRRPTDETFSDGLSLHNIVKNALSKQNTFEVVDPILLNELLRREYNGSSKVLNEEKKKKSKISGDPLGVLSSWNDSVHFCEWNGVSCSRRHYGRVIELNVSSHGLSGSISPYVGNLSFLKFLRLYNNSFTGEIPPEIGRLRRLERLSLYNNLLDGEIPSNISGCYALTVFRVEYNELVGGLPWQFGLLSKLQNFFASSNHLTGSIPFAFGNLSSLLVFDGGNNQLSGRVPNTLGRLKSLIALHLSFNNLSGEIPTSIFNLTSLTNLWLGFNYQLHGNLPWNLGVTLPNLEYFDVAANQFTGSVPPSLSNASNLVLLQLGSNNFTGSMPSMAGSNKLLHFMISDNYLGSGKANDLSFLSSLTNATNLEGLDIQINNFGGSLPQHLGNLSKNLKRLAFYDNKISGNIPSSIQYLVSLAEFWVYNNDLSGVLPVEVGNLKNLGILDLSHNMLAGNIPISLSSCISLQGLYLQGNSLQGIIPSSFSSLRGIQELDLSSNNLSGQIPKFLESMDISSLLNLSYNNFDGEVPTQGAFKNSSIVSVVGNSKLCGGVTALQLPPCSFTRHTKKTMSLKWKIVISTISSLLFLTFIGSCCFILLIKQRRRRDKSSMDDPKLLQLSYQKLFEATNGFSSANQIGVGSFGSVYKGVLNEIGEASINIAVKVFNLQRRGASKSFMAECEALRNIRHKNLVRIVTVCSSVDHEGNDFKALIYEFLANGSLEDWLHRPIERIDEFTTTRSLNFIQRLHVAIDIASAVDYLHNNCGTPIVHCDIKPSNVLLDEDMAAHVGDFGLARFLSAVTNPSSSTIGIKGTVGYAPPEYGMGNEVSTQGDIYSYGILLLELFTGKRPTGETFKDGVSLHNIVKSALSKQRTSEVLDPILLNELLRRLTTHHNYTTSSSDEARKDLEKLMSSILEIGVACSSDIPQERKPSIAFNMLA
ncbi:Probable LRR receptor-like serine/threonine-protein kinase At3g47570 [Linum perenne]